MLRWIKKATCVWAAQWRSTHFTRHALKCITPSTKILAPILYGHDLFNRRITGKTHQIPQLTTKNQR
ncbi:hypothetical protein DFAR_1040001 [Desulfarculales bacterium]